MIIDAVDVLHQIIIVTVIIQITMIDVDFIFRYRFGMKNVLKCVDKTLLSVIKCRGFVHPNIQIIGKRDGDN